MSDINRSAQRKLVLTADEAYNRFFTPARRSPTEVENIVMKQAEVSYLQSDLSRIPLYSWGVGPTVMLMHGWGGCASQLSAFVLPLLNLGYRVLACDLPAHGQTAGEQTNVFEFAQILLEVAASENKFTGIVAHSWGAGATIIAMSEHEIAEKVVCLGTPCWLSSSVTTISKLLRLSSQTEDSLRRLFEQRLGQDVWQRASMELRAENLTVPGLLFHDRKDRKISYKESQAIVDTWKDAEFILTSGLGHNRILKDSEVIQRTVNFF